MSVTERPKARRVQEVYDLIDSGLDLASEIEVMLVFGVECDICGPLLRKSKSNFVGKETIDAPWSDDGTAQTGTLYIPADEGILLVGDAEDMLNEHWERVHPGVPRVFIEDGQHVRMARKGLHLP